MKWGARDDATAARVAALAPSIRSMKINPVDVYVEVLPFLLYIAHTLLETALGAVKLRGKYAEVDSMPPEAAKFCRHHGISLLALALLGGECARRGLINTQTGALCSLVLCAFHAGAVAVMAYDSNMKVVVTHLPFAIAFGLHAATVKPRAPRGRK